MTITAALSLPAFAAFDVLEIGIAGVTCGWVAVGNARWGAGARSAVL